MITVVVVVLVVLVVVGRAFSFFAGLYRSTIDRASLSRRSRGLGESIAESVYRIYLFVRCRVRQDWWDGRTGGRTHFPSEYLSKLAGARGCLQWGRWSFWWAVDGGWEGDRWWVGEG